MSEIVINDETTPGLNDFDLPGIADAILENLGPKMLGPLLKKALVAGLELLAQYVPKEVMKYVAMVSDGITDDEFKKIQEELVAIADEKIDIKRVPDWLEPAIFRTIIGSLLSLAKTGRSFPVKQS